MQSVRVTATAADPAPRSMFSLVYVPEKHYSLMFGGQIDSPGASFEPRNDLFVLNVSSHNRWTSLPTTGQAPPARCGHTAALVVDDMHMFVWGGRDKKQLADTHLYVLDVAQRVWHCLESVGGAVPQGRFQHLSWAVGDRVYVFGGHDGRRTCFRDLHVARVDLERHQAHWEELKPHGEVPRLSGASAAVEFNGHLISIGGSNSQEFSSDVHAYSLADNVWRKFTAVGNIPAARAALSAFIAHNRIFVFGGSSGHLRFNDLYCLDLDFASGVATWARFPLAGDVPEGRSLHAMTVDRDQNVYLYGGWSGSACYGDLHVLTALPVPPPPPPSALFSLESAFGDAALADCTLICGGARFAAHRVILAARSRVFRYWIESWGAEREIAVHDMAPAVLETLLRWMYSGRAAIAPALALDVLLAADKYALDGLRVAAAREVVAGLSFGSVHSVAALAEAMGLTAVRHVALLFAAANAPAMREHRSQLAPVPAPAPAPVVAPAAGGSVASVGSPPVTPTPSPLSALPCPIQLRGATPPALLAVGSRDASPQPSSSAPSTRICGKRAASAAGLDSAGDVL